MGTKAYFTKSERDIAVNQNLANTLITMGYGLEAEGNGYRGIIHDSFVIPNKNKNEWHWNSKDLHGKEPIGCLTAILHHDFGYDEKEAYVLAIKRLARTEGQNLPIDNSYTPPVIKKTKEDVTEKSAEFSLPERNGDMKRTFAYLCQTRKLDTDIIKELAKEGKIYETKSHNNACFVAYDKTNKPRHGYLRGTNTYKDFKKDIDYSDKAYAFTIRGKENATKVCCFESAIDAISHATLYKMYGYDYKDTHRISLDGTSFLGLEQFLADNPKITTIVACLDNDDTGNKRSKKLLEEYAEKGYRTLRHEPKAKDFNEMLINRVEASICEKENANQHKDEKQTQDEKIDEDVCI